MIHPCPGVRLHRALLNHALCAACALLLAGCTSAVHNGPPARVAVSPSTGRVMQSGELKTLFPGLILGDYVYAEVNSEWLRQWYPRYRAELFRLGVVRGNERFDCNHFASFYTGLAQALYFDHAFHSRTAAQLALGPFWYRRADGLGGHVVIQAMTERGRIFIEPQTGAELTLTAPELASAFLQYF